MAGYGLDQSSHLDRLLEKDLLDKGIASKINNHQFQETLPMEASTELAGACKMTMIFSSWV